MTQNNSDKLRTRLKATRIHIPVANRQRGSLLMRARLFTWFAITSDEARDAGLNAPTSIAAFWPLSDEPDLRPLLTQWDEAGILVTLPVMSGRGEPLTFHRWTADTRLVEGSFGVKEPSADSEQIEPDVVLVPTLGFTTHLDRMGYGQGYYDRTLQAMAARGRAPVTIGIAWNEGAIEAIEPDYQPASHDYRLDGILTPDGWVGGVAPALLPSTQPGGTSA